MEHRHRPYLRLVFPYIEGCKCGHYRVARDGSVDFSKWKLDYFRGRMPFRKWLKAQSDAMVADVEGLTKYAPADETKE